MAKITTYNPQTSQQTAPYDAAKFNVQDGIEIKTVVDANDDEFQELSGRTTGTNSGDETQSSIVTKLGTVLSNKVDKVTGKQLSTNDYTDTEKTKLGALPLAADLATSLSNKADLVAGKVPAAQLPSYVDDVIDVANFAALPSPGETGKIYVTDDTNKQYRWSGSAYIELVASPGTTDNVPEGTTNKYWTLARTLGSVLTGYVVAVGNTAIASTDTVLQAFQKIGGSISDIYTSIALKANSSDVTTALGLKQSTSEKNQNNGYAGLGSDGKLPDDTLSTNIPIMVAGKVQAANLPSYVDDVLEFANLAAFPATGESGKLYIAIDSNFVYRWTGSVYVRVDSVDLTAYATKTGAETLTNKNIIAPTGIVATDIGGLATALALKAPFEPRYKTVAKKIQQLEASKGAFPTALTSPPTITLSAAQSYPTFPGGITNSVLTPATSSIFTFLGTSTTAWNYIYCPGATMYYAANVSLDSDAARVPGSKKGGVLRTFFETDADVLEIALFCTNTGYGNGYRIWVDGQPTAIAARTDLTSFNVHFASVNFGLSKRRRIIVETDIYVCFSGVRVGPYYSVWKITYNSPRTIVIGDSYTLGTGATSQLSSFASEAAALLGIEDAWMGGEGQIGYLQVGVNSGLNALQKLATDVIAFSPDFVVINLGINDTGQVAATLQTQVTNYFTQLFTGLPNVLVTVIGPFRAPTANPSTGIYNAIKTAVQALSQNATGQIAYVDTLADVWQSGTGKTTAVSGVGNSNIYIGSDGLHPIQVGHDYLAYRERDAIMAHMNSLAG